MNKLFYYSDLSIEIEKKTEEVSHQENLFWEAKCYTCPDFSEEDGTIFEPPQTIIGWWKESAYEEALALAQEHEEYYRKLRPDEDHRIVISYWDIGAIREALWGKEG